MNGNNMFCMSHSVNIVISQLIICNSFWQSYLTGRVWLPFYYNYHKLWFAARYQYIFIMLLKKLITKKMTVLY